MFTDPLGASVANLILERHYSIDAAVIGYLVDTGRRSRVAAYSTEQTALCLFLRLGIPQAPKTI